MPNAIPTKLSPELFKKRSSTDVNDQEPQSTPENILKLFYNCQITKLLGKKVSKWSNGMIVDGIRINSMMSVNAYDSLRTFKYIAFPSSSTLQEVTQYPCPPGPIEVIINALGAKDIPIEERTSLRIHLLISDMASFNVSAWSEFGIMSCRNQITASNDHPSEYARKLFAIPDVEHLIKSIRNMLTSYDFIYVEDESTLNLVTNMGTHNIIINRSSNLQTRICSWKVVCLLVQLEDDLRIDKKSKLSKKHLNVEYDRFSKMNVPLALDVFSHQTAAAIREIDDEYLIDNDLSCDEREGTAYFIDLMAEWIDWLLNPKKEMNEIGLKFNAKIKNLFSTLNYREDLDKKKNKQKSKTHSSNSVQAKIQSIPVTNLVTNDDDTSSDESSANNPTQPKYTIINTFKPIQRGTLLLCDFISEFKEYFKTHIHQGLTAKFILNNFNGSCIEHYFSRIKYKIDHPDHQQFKNSLRRVLSAQVTLKEQETVHKMRMKMIIDTFFRGMIFFIQFQSSVTC